ncbi:MAG: redoxin domain-containing protein [Pyrinomonadaceae bacterium]|nr:redoxin domain-containing protein [Pyrinomonadaceae bacterium]
MKKILFLSLTAILCLSNTLAQTKKTVTPSSTKSSTSAQITPATAIKQLRDFFFNRDYIGGVKEGNSLTVKFPDNQELQAWHLINLVKLDSPAGFESSQKFLAEKGENRWTLTALCFAQSYNKPSEAISTAEKLIKLAPDDEDTIFIYNNAIYKNSKYADSDIWLDKNAAKIKDQSRLLVAKALNSYYLAKSDAAKKQQAFDLLTKAVALSPNSVNANFIYGYQLAADKRFDEAIPFFRKAAKFSPKSWEIEKSLLESMANQSGKDQAQNLIEVEKEITTYFNNNSSLLEDSPDVLFGAASLYETLKNDEKRDFYENKVLQKFPNTKFDEAVLYNRIERAQKEMVKDFDINKTIESLGKMSEGTKPDMSKFLEDSRKRMEKMNAIKKMRQDFIKRPNHFDTVKLGETYYSLLNLSNFDILNGDENIKELIEGVLKYKKNTTSQIMNSEIAKILTRAKINAKDNKLVQDAEKYARAGMDDVETMLKEKPALAMQKLDIPIRGNAKLVLAEVFLKDGNLDEAEKLLTEIQSTIPSNGVESGQIASLSRSIDRDFAELYTNKKDFDKAEGYYLKNVTGREALDLIPFRTLYAKKTGSREGLDVYLAQIKEKINLKLKNDLLSSRIKTPKDLAAFNLQTIEGKPFSSEELKGKVAVINFWGTWCAPCVAEMPDFQKLVDKYKNDKDVVILTMDSNDELADVKKFMVDKKYNFPVLIGDTYTGNIMFNSSIAFPTTLFVGKTGKIEFVKISNSPRLFDEFSWRIDILKEDK